jgi:hypothetical protein
MPGIDIEILEGETLMDAIKRVSEATAPEKKAPKKKAEPKVTVTDPSAGETVQPDVYAAIHVYQREGELESVTRSNGTRERQMHGPGTLVFVHMHSFGAPCSPACRERVLKDDA